jgi:hypothetical protein
MTLTKTVPFFTILILALQIFSCVQQEIRKMDGRDFNDRLVKGIVEGQTNKQEIIGLFGSPFEQSAENSATEKYVYVYELSDEQQSRIYTKKLVILFNNGIVMKYNFIEKEETKGERKTEQSNEKVMPLKIGF